MMIEQKDENLNELLMRFYDRCEAEQIGDEIRDADQMLDSFVAPEPDLAGIKSTLASRLGQKSRAKVLYRAVAIAAAVVIIAAGLNIYIQQNAGIETGPTVATMPTQPWQSIASAQSDADMAVFSAEAEEIEEELIALELAESDNGNGEIAGLIEDMEAELIEIETVFWEG